MASTVTFWWLPDEEETFLTFLETTGEVLASPFAGAQKKEELIARPVREYITDLHPHQCFFFSAEFSDELIIEPCKCIEGDKTVERFRVVDMKSCVIGYDRGKDLGSGKLTASNLYAYWDYPNASGTSLIRKPERFTRWAKKVFSWVHKSTPEWHMYKNYHVSKRVKEAILNGGLQIVPY
jgi:hypothetical protein